MTYYNEVEMRKRAEELRNAALLGVTVCAFAAITSMVIIPMLHSYLQYVHTQVEDEVRLIYRIERSQMQKSRCHLKLLN
ncbi:hypothetical protein ANCCAN_06233 [Ancylostoma caninum]|uniref:Nematode cuticle collagen N-terminal domain-containing protein n=1 Tax=Ancylostoma caninum TaxID=29170 RepID=A0A368GWF2_ANCCA|nr:hypothetical protein ANCCAN_06233 [Ancylostoma caninum]